ncbi:MAG: glycoside hydrolase family 5 protein [Spirochaetota bacterium]
MAFTINRGTNISHWLSQSASRGEERRKWFTRDDVSRIAGWGLDHIRLPIDEEQMWSVDGTRQAEAFDLLSSAVDWCEAEGLRVVVDLHILRSHYFNDQETPALFTDPAARTQLADLWLDLSEFLGPRSNDLVAYEILNEAVAPTAEAWNETWRVPFDAIRGREAERTIVLGSNHFNQWQTYPELDVPDDDALILTFHYYNPMFITHYTAKWWHAGGSYSGPIRYPGRPIPDSQHIAIERLKDAGLEQENRKFDREVMRADMSVPREIASKTGHRLYCGEFGCYNQTPDDIREAWYRDIASCFRELDIDWANWDYKGHFGLIDRDGNETGVLGWLMS